MSLILASLPLELQVAVCDRLSDVTFCALARTSKAEASFVREQWKARLSVSVRAALSVRRADVSLGDRFGLFTQLLKPLGRLGSRKALHSTLSLICEMVKAGDCATTSSDGLLTKAESDEAVKASLNELGSKFGWRATYEAIHRWTCVSCDGLTPWVHVGRCVRLCRACALSSCAEQAPIQSPADEQVLGSKGGADVELVMVGCWFYSSQPLFERTALRGGVFSIDLPSCSHFTAKASAAACSAPFGSVSTSHDTSACVPASEAARSVARPCLLLWGPKSDFLPWMAAQGETIMEAAPADADAPLANAVAAEAPATEEQLNLKDRKPALAAMMPAYCGERRIMPQASQCPLPGSVRLPSAKAIC